MGNCCTTREREYGNLGDLENGGGLDDIADLSSKKKKNEVYRSLPYISKYFEESNHPFRFNTLDRES
jgi:hypothetical protein